MTLFPAQRTLRTSVSCRGVGLHSGQAVRLTLRPAPAGHGVTFVRTDRAPPLTIPARAERVVDTSLATTLGLGAPAVGTVEHLMAAAAGLEVDNLIAELDGPEVPVMDGSAADFVELIEAAGIRELDVPRETWVVTRPVTLREGDKEATLLPASHRTMEARIDFDHPLIGEQSIELELTPRSFKRELARARTFGFARDVARLRELGLARGGSLENAVVLDDQTLLSPGGLRFPDEFVRHKLLDAIGDLALLGAPVLGHLRVVRAGHALHVRLIEKALNENAIVRERSPRGRRVAEVPAFAAPLVA